MLKKKIKVAVKLEARPVAMLVQVASQFQSSIYIEKEAMNINAKSIMGMMTLSLVPGEELLVSADGEDENQAVRAIEEFLGEA